MDFLFDENIEEKRDISCQLIKGSFVENLFQRESQSSSLSNAFGYKIENDQSKEKISCSEHFLFFGSLILFLILLISGIIVFIIMQQQTFKHGNKDQFSNGLFYFNEKELLIGRFLEDFLPLSKVNQFTFARNRLRCGLNR